LWDWKGLVSRSPDSVGPPFFFRPSRHRRRRCGLTAIFFSLFSLLGIRSPQSAEWIEYLASKPFSPLPPQEKVPLLRQIIGLSALLFFFSPLFFCSQSELRRLTSRSVLPFKAPFLFPPPPLFFRKNVRIDMCENTRGVHPSIVALFFSPFFLGRKRKESWGEAFCLLYLFSPREREAKKILGSMSPPLSPLFFFLIDSPLKQLYKLTSHSLPLFFFFSIAMLYRAHPVRRH